MAKGRPETRRVYNRKRSSENREYMRAYNKARNFKIKKAALTFYSLGDEPECVCCGERCITFLTIDHIHGGGGVHRRAIKSQAQRIYEWLIKEGYPEGYQTLCANCNQSRMINGVCEHHQVFVVPESIPYRRLAEVRQDRPATR